MVRKREQSATRRQRQGEDVLAAAASASPHGLMIEQRGHVVYANAAFARLVGARRPQELLGRPVAEVPHISGPAAPRGRKPAPEYQTVRSAFGHRGMRMAITVVRDVSYAKRLERELREAQKMELLGRMVGGVAHDFNNVLAAVTLYSDLLLAALDGEDASARHAQAIRAAADQGAAIVRQLLAFARPHPTEARHVSVNEVLETARDLMQRMLGEHIEIVFACTDALPTVLAEPAQLQEIVLNLAMNSRDAMASGGTLTVSTALKKVRRAARAYPGLPSGDYVALSVSDTGCGMDARTRARIFEPFFTTKASGKGTGLGMSTVYRIVRQAGGTVTVDSELGKGTRVTVLLPASHAGAPVAGPPTAEVPLDGKGRTVLVVEDNAAVRQALCELLHDAGYRVLQARDSEEALHRARRFPGSISLFITDIEMPGGCGCHAAREVVRAHPAARVLFISGYPANGRTPTAGAVLLDKPFSRATLAEKIREVLHLPNHQMDDLLGLACHGKEMS